MPPHRCRVKERPNHKTSIWFDAKTRLKWSSSDLVGWEQVINQVCRRQRCTKQSVVCHADTLIELGHWLCPNVVDYPSLRAAQLPCLTFSQKPAVTLRLQYFFLSSLLISPKSQITLKCCSSAEEAITGNNNPAFKITGPRVKILHAHLDEGTVGETDKIRGKIALFPAPAHKQVRLRTYRSDWQWYQRKPIWDDETQSSFCGH